MPYLAIDSVVNKWVLVSVWSNGARSRIEPAPEVLIQFSNRDPAYVLRPANEPPGPNERLITLVQGHPNGRNRRSPLSALYHTLIGHTAQLTEAWPKLSQTEQVVHLLQLIDHQTSGNLSTTMTTRINKAKKAISLAISTTYPAESNTAYATALRILSDCADFKPNKEEKYA